MKKKKSTSKSVAWWYCIILTQSLDPSWGVMAASMSLTPERFYFSSRISVRRITYRNTQNHKCFSQLWRPDHQTRIVWWHWLKKRNFGIRNFGTPNPSFMPRASSVILCLRFKQPTGNRGVLGSIPSRGERDDWFFQPRGWISFSMVSCTAAFLVLLLQDRGY
jgi:hypothetical protein